MEIAPITVDNQHEDGLLRTWQTYLRLADRLAIAPVTPKRKRFNQQKLHDAEAKAVEVA